MSSVNNVELFDSDDEEVVMRWEEARRKRQAATEALARTHAEEEAREEAERQARRLGRAEEQRRQEETLRHEEEERRKQEREGLRLGAKKKRQNKLQGDRGAARSAQTTEIDTRMDNPDVVQTRAAKRQRKETQPARFLPEKMGGPNPCARCVQFGRVCVAQELKYLISFSFVSSTNASSNSIACEECRAQKHKCEMPTDKAATQLEEAMGVREPRPRQQTATGRSSSEDTLIQALEHLVQMHDQAEERAHEARMEQLMERICVAQEKLAGIVNDVNNAGQVDSLCPEMSSGDGRDAME